MDREKEIVGREIKICLFDESSKSFKGNTIRVHSYWSEKLEDQWNFTSTKGNRKTKMNQFLIRKHQMSKTDAERLAVIFEFVVFYLINDKIQ